MCIFYYKTFLKRQFALQDLRFWSEAENFCTSKNFKNARACQIRRRFLNQQYFLGPLSPATKEQQLQVFLLLPNSFLFVCELDF